MYVIGDRSNFNAPSRLSCCTVAFKSMTCRGLFDRLRDCPVMFVFFRWNPPVGPSRMRAFQMLIFRKKGGNLAKNIKRSSCSLFCILYDAKRTYNENICDSTFSDADFIEWSSKVLHDELPNIDTSKNYLFRGYYQHDKIFLKYKNNILIIFV